MLLNGKQLGFTLDELNEFTISYFYELLDIYIALNSEEEKEESNVIVADQSYYDRLYNR